MVHPYGAVSIIGPSLALNGRCFSSRDDNAVLLDIGDRCDTFLYGEEHVGRERLARLEDPLSSSRDKGIEVERIAGARLKYRDVVITPTSVAGEKPARRENGRIESKAAGEPGCGIGERAPAVLHLIAVEKI